MVQYPEQVRFMRIKALEASVAALSDGITQERTLSAMQKATVFAREVLMLPGGGAELFGISLVTGILSQRTQAQEAITHFLLPEKRRMFEDMRRLYESHHVENGFPYISSISTTASNLAEVMSRNPHAILQQVTIGLGTRFLSLPLMREYFSSAEHVEAEQTITPEVKGMYDRIVNQVEHGPDNRQLRREEGLEE